jgi:hypothetical protein
MSLVTNPPEYKDVYREKLYFSSTKQSSTAEALGNRVIFTQFPKK